MITSIFYIIYKLRNLLYYLLSQCEKTLSNDELD